MCCLLVRGLTLPCFSFSPICRRGCCQNTFPPPGHTRSCGCLRAQAARAAALLLVPPAQSRRLPRLPLSRPRRAQSSPLARSRTRCWSPSRTAHSTGAWPDFLGAGLMSAPIRADDVPVAALRSTLLPPASAPALSFRASWTPKASPRLATPPPARWTRFRLQRSRRQAQQTQAQAQPPRTQTHDACDTRARNTDLALEKAQLHRLSIDRAS